MDSAAQIAAASALLIIGADGRLRYASEAAKKMLRFEGAQPQAEHWQDSLVHDASSRFLLAQMLAQEAAVALPTLIFRDDCLCSGALAPISFKGETASLLILWRTPPRLRSEALATLAQADIVAAIALDHLRYDEDWSGADTVALFDAIADELRVVVRGEDAVVGTFDGAVILCLKAVDEVSAADISRALISHVYAAVTGPEGLRLTVGLARIESDLDFLPALTRARRSAMLAQRENLNEPVRVSQKGDDARVLGDMLGEMLGRVVVQKPVSVPHTSQEIDKPTQSTPVIKHSPPIAPIETDIEGYVVDNMEGAVDQAMFLARLDVPVAIVGAAGTGKMYVARIIHEQRGLAGDLLSLLDCRELRSRASAMRRIAAELQTSLASTLVMKSPHLLHPEVQKKLARQISTRTLADVSPPRYLADIKFIALFPEPIERLVQRGELLPALASVYAGFPIEVPPIRDRKQAVLRWAHKILGQEGASRDRVMKGFTPDAERAMLTYAWPGNISEMRACIQTALERTDKDWLTPVDLGLFEGIDTQGAMRETSVDAFLSLIDEAGPERPVYEPSAAERLDQALGEAVHDMMKLELIKPLGIWLEDDLVLAVLDRYRQDIPKAAQFLHTSARNVRRWLPKIESREPQRSASNLWQKPARVLREWVRETPPPAGSPITMMQDKLMVHLREQGVDLSAAKRAQVLGVSTPTYLKRLRALQPDYGTSD